MRVAIVTPYYDEPIEMLRECYESVRAQTYPCTHFLVSDGLKRGEVLEWSAEHLFVPGPHGDNGNTPRGFGSVAADTEKFDAIAYLDADNWFAPTHVEAMVDLQRKSGADVCTATRSIHRMDGAYMYTDRQGFYGLDHVDTSCFFLTRKAFGVIPLWAGMPKELSPICDRVIWDAIRGRKHTHAHHSEATVAFRTRYRIHYENIGEAPPPGTKYNEETTGKAIQWWNALPSNVREEWIRYFEGRV